HAPWPAGGRARRARSMGEDPTPRHPAHGPRDRATDRGGTRQAAAGSSLGLRLRLARAPRGNPARSRQGPVGGIRMTDAFDADALIYAVNDPVRAPAVLRALA